MGRWGQAAWAAVGLAAALGILLWLTWLVRVIFSPLLLAGVIVLLLNPLVVRLERKRIPRVAATALLYLAGVALFTLAVVSIVPVVRAQAEDFRGHWPEVQARVEQWVADRENDVRGTPLEFTREDLANQFAGRVTDRLPELWRAGDRVLNVLIVLLTGPVIAFYLLADLPRLRARAEELLPRRAAPEAVFLARRLHAVVGGFVRGQIIVATIVAILTSAALALLGLPFWALLGLIAGVSDLVPLVGPFVGGLVAVVVALVTRDATTAVWVVAVMVAVQQLESHVISPLVLHRTVKLHPAAVLLALLAGASLGGILGMLVAAPAVAALKVLVGHLWLVYVLGQPPEELEGAGPPTDERKLWLPRRAGDRDGAAAGRAGARA
ncbi:MAG TPA: AI-2E family transporter [Acidimicrobiales bacterium]|nr:AI-2E family transporter [Acidimicrobiales bacterium]